MQNTGVQKNMKNVLLLSLILVTGFTANVTVYMFVGEGCPHCAEAKPYMFSLQQKYPEMELKIFEIYHNKSNAELLSKMARAYGTMAMGVPTYFIDKKMLVGFSNGFALDPKTGKEVSLEEEIKRCVTQGCVDPGVYAGIINETKNEPNNTSNNTSNNTTTTPVQKPEEQLIENTSTEQIDWVKNTSLVIVTAAADSVNPCIMAVLTFLLSVLFTYKRDKKKIIEVGALYTTIVYVTYFVLGLFLVVGLGYIIESLKGAGSYTLLVRMFVAAVVLIAGIINIKDFFWYGKGITFVLPKKYKAKIKRLSEKFAEKGSISAILLIALIVTIVEFPCSGMMYLGIITYFLSIGLPGHLIIGYLILYNIVFVIPLIVITWLARESVSKLEETRLKYRRWFRSIMGIVLVLLAIMLVII